MALTIDIEDHSHVSVLRLRGDLTITSDGLLVRKAKPLLEGENARIVLDMGGVAFISSAGLGDLVRLAAHANSQGGRIVLANLTPFVAGVLNTTKLDNFFDVRGDVNEAMDGLDATATDDRAAKREPQLAQDTGSPRH
ncbi:MAG: STAS domain-containing protein [Phycisphaerae bacterium]|nr:STAS domain-containing protein [Phycisphaerae bacterium]